MRFAWEHAYERRHGKQSCTAPHPSLADDLQGASNTNPLVHLRSGLDRDFGHGRALHGNEHSAFPCCSARLVWGVGIYLTSLNPTRLSFAKCRSSCSPSTRKAFMRAFSCYQASLSSRAGSSGATDHFQDSITVGSIQESIASYTSTRLLSSEWGSA